MEPIFLVRSACAVAFQLRVRGSPSASRWGGVRALCSDQQPSDPTRNGNSGPTLQTPLSTLGLPPTATPLEARIAYYRLAKACHPDVVATRPPAEPLTGVAVASADEAARFRDLSSALATVLDELNAAAAAAREVGSQGDRDAAATLPLAQNQTLFAPWGSELPLAPNLGVPGHVPAPDDRIAPAATTARRRVRHRIGTREEDEAAEQRRLAKLTPGERRQASGAGGSGGGDYEKSSCFVGADARGSALGGLRKRHAAAQRAVPPATFTATPALGRGDLEPLPVAAAVGLFASNLEHWAVLAELYKDYMDLLSNEVRPRARGGGGSGGLAV